MSKRRIFFISGLLFSTTVLAQIDLEAIEVKANKEPSRFNFGSSESISETEMEERPALQLSNLIDSLPGIISNQNGGPGGRVSFFVRGTESRHLAFTLDGLKLNDVSNNDRQFDAAFLSSPILQEMKIFKGPQAVLIGSDSFGGLVEMKTRKGENAPQTRLHLSGGSFGTASGALSSDWKSKDQQGTLTYSHQRSDGLSRLNKKRFNAHERDSSDISQATSSSRHGWGNNQTDLLLSFIQGKNELDGFTDDNSADKSKNDQYLIQQKTSHQFSKDTAVSLRNGLNRHQRFIKMQSFGNETYAGNSIQNELVLEKKLSSAEFLGGLAAEHEDTETRSIDRAFDLQSAFIQSLFTFNSLSFQGGVRADQHSKYGQFQTGSAGLSFLKENQKFYLQYSQGYKAPSLYQLFDPQFGSRDLSPERNHSWEGGWKWNQERYGIETSVFQNRLSNLITFTSGGFRNQGDFIVEGVEVQGRYTAEKVTIRPGFVHQNFRNEESVILRRPQNMSSLQVSWFPAEVWELYSKVRWYSSRKDIDPEGNTVKLNGFEAIDLGAHYKVNQNDYSLQLINILDREYEEIYGYSVMPRSIFIGYGRTFSL